MHTDACDVTLNVCLGREFTGAGLTFCGLRGDPSQRERTFTYRHTHVVGRAVVHLGHHRHGADDIVSGERCARAPLCALQPSAGPKRAITPLPPAALTARRRFNLIMWNKSSTYRLTQEFLAKYRRAPEAGGAKPDLVCLSYTHDDDYEKFKVLSPEKRAKRDARGG